MSAVLQTRRVYRFQKALFRDIHGPLHRERPMAELQRLARRIWQERSVATPCPRVVAGRGIGSCHAEDWLVSYADKSSIVLARNQRTAHVLLHELAHHIAGPRVLDHGPKFQRIFFELIARYDPPLVLAAALECSL